MPEAPSTGLQHRHQHRAATIDPHLVALRRRPIVNVGDIADRHCGPIDGADRQGIQLFDSARAVVEVDAVFEVADLCSAGGHDLVLRCQRGADVAGREAMGLQRGGVEVDLDLPLAPAIGRGDRRALHFGQPGPDEVLTKVEDLLFGLGRRGQRQLEDRHGRGIIVQDQRGGDPRRHLLQHRLRHRGDLRGGGADIDSGAEEYLHDPDTVQRLAFDMVDIVDRRRQLALVIIDDAPGHVFGRQAAIRPHRRDHGQANIRKNVGWRLDP